MTINKTRKQEITEELMRSFFEFLGKQESDFTEIAFEIATKKNTGTYFEMFKEANVITSFAMFLLLENTSILENILSEQSVPIQDLLKLGLIESDIEMFKIH